nr:CTP synthase [FCB group bacterium]
LGKGITAASIAMLLRRRGYRVSMQKLDPYLNVDPGTMSPFQHGEVFVTNDGAETDLDLGHYERFGGITCTKNSNYTAGQIYSTVLTREREGDYLGKTVQVIPHITDEIKKAVLSQAEPGIDIAITELGGTVGDIEGLPFVEALRQLKWDLGSENVVYVHLTLIPYLATSGELKTKPSQQSVGILRSIGIIPDILICRTSKSLEEEHLEKLSMFCNVAREAVIEEKDVKDSIYEVPVELAKQKIDQILLKHLNLPLNDLDLTDWMDMLRRAITPTQPEIIIGVVGKYMSLRDSYKSVFEALQHGAIAIDARLESRGIEAEDVSAGDYSGFEGVHGILVPGGFGIRGIEGKIEAVRYARENNIPFLGICLGMQCAVIETARNLAGMKDANSSEFEPGTPHPVISLLEEQKEIKDLGGTMRLGAWPCTIKSGTLAEKVFGRNDIADRHRHRYEYNNDYTKQLDKAGLIRSGTSPDGYLVEIIEREDHLWFIACQFHPEFKSTPLKPAPLFRDFIVAARSYRRRVLLDELKKMRN